MIYPFNYIPDDSEVLQLLPHRSKVPVILWRTERYLLAVNRSAKIIADANQWTMHTDTVNGSIVQWLALPNTTSHGSMMPWVRKIPVCLVVVD